MDKKLRRELRSKGQAMKPTVIVGKEGISESVVMELDRQVKKMKLVKVRVLHTPEEGIEDFAARLASASHSDLVETRGKTVLLHRER